MSQTEPARDEPMQREAPDFPEVPERPALAPDVQLCGPMESGFEDRQWLVQRAGVFIQLPEVFYRVAEQADGTRTVVEIAEAVSAVTGRQLTAEHIRLIVGAKLIPKEIVVAEASAAPARKRTAVRPPLAMRIRTKMIGPSLIDPITRVLQFLYVPPVLIAVLILVAISHGWLYLVHGLPGNVYNILYVLSMIPAVLPLNILGAAFHELGHAAALRYGGGKVRGIGAGLYLIYPVFFTDVTDNYRLSRWDRVRTDLGGFYFTLIFTLAMIAAYLITGQEIFLLVVFLLDAEIVFQSLPFVRFDGYWILADLTGIPDFFSQMGAFLRAVLPLPRWKGYRLPKLKGWVQLIFGLYILVTVPLLTFLLVRILQTLPDVLAVTWSTLGKQLGTFSTALRAGDPLAIAVSVLQTVLLALPTGGLLLIVTNAGRSLQRAVWKWTKPLPARSTFRAIGTAVILGLVAFLWLPQESFTMMPLLRRLPQNIMAAREAVWEHVGALSGRHQAGDIGNLVLVTTLALIGLELCFVLFDLINLANTWVRSRWWKHTRYRGNQLPPAHRILSPAEAADNAAHQENQVWLSHLAAELGQAGKTDREIQELLIAAGLDADTAQVIVTSLSAGRLSARKHAVRQVVVTGAIVSTLGATVTLGGWWAGVNPSAIMLAGCATVVAGVRLFRGLLQNYSLSTSTSDRVGLAAAVRQVRKPLQPRVIWSFAGVLMLGAGYGLWEVYLDHPRVAAQESARHQAAPGTSLPVKAETPGLAAAQAATATEDPLDKEVIAATANQQRVSEAPGVARQADAVEAPMAQSVERSSPAATTTITSVPGDLAVPATADPLPGPGASSTPTSPPTAAGVSIPGLGARPMTGMVQLHLPLTGVGELQLANAAQKDGLVTIARAGHEVASVYVRAGEIYTIRGIPDGVYTIVTSQGDGWDGNLFTSNVNPKRVEELVTFQTTAQEYAVWEISLVDQSLN